MKVLELFAGGRSFSKVAKENGHTTWDTDIEPLEGIDLALDILDFEPNMCPFIPDVIWASPPCETFSVASIGRHWTSGYEFKPKTDRAVHGIIVLERLHELIRRYLALNPNLIWYAENPRGKMRKAPQWSKLKHVRHTVTYCQYGHFAMKPTDVWTNNTEWEPRPKCKNGDPCHEAAPRSSKNSGTAKNRNYLTRSAIPSALCQEIVDSSVSFQKHLIMSQTQFRNLTDEGIVEAYKKQCENNGWTSSRATYLSELHHELMRRFDCSEIITHTAMSLKSKNVELKDNKIVLT